MNAETQRRREKNARTEKLMRFSPAPISASLRLCVQSILFGVAMYKTLSPGAIGVKADTLEAGLAAATTGGFEGLEVPATQLADAVDRIGAEAVKKLFADARIRPAAFGLPVDWRTSEENWR